MASQSQPKPPAQTLANRVILAGVGSLAAIALWALSESWDTHVVPPMLYLALFSFVAVYAAVALALIGPVPATRGLIGALVIAVPETLLICLASLRFEMATDVLDQPLILCAWVLLGFLATPFLSVGLQDRSRWRRYEDLFENAWEMVARYLLAWAFVGIFWLVLFLSDALLELVKITLIDTIIQTDWLRFGLSGGVLGLALAVVHEWRERVPTFLLVRLLRLLVPVMLLVVGIFLLAIPFRGLGEVFGDFSAAGTLMATAILAVTLITIALERSSERADLAGPVAMAVRLLILTLPLLSGLAAWAIVVRVGAYGWTPERVAAATACLVIVLYALFYAGLALSGTHWMERVRQVNLVMAGVTIALSILWLTPVFDALRISSKDQVRRFEQGQTTQTQLPLWEMAHDWGKPGHDALEALAEHARDAGDTAFEARISKAHGADSPFQFDLKTTTEAAPELAQRLAEIMPVLPQGAALEADDLRGLTDFDLRRWLAGCNRSLIDGRPGCVLVRGDFSPSLSADQQGIVVFLNRNDGVSASFLKQSSEGVPASGFVFDAMSGTEVELSMAQFLDLISGQFNIGPSGIQGLHIDGRVLSPRH